MNIIREEVALTTDTTTNAGADNKNALVNEVSKRWRNISSEERAHFQRLSDLDKERYAREMQEWEQQVEQAKKNAMVLANQSKDTIENTMQSTGKVATDKVVANTTTTATHEDEASFVEVSNDKAVASFENMQTEFPSPSQSSTVPRIDALTTESSVKTDKTSAASTVDTTTTLPGMTSDDAGLSPPPTKGPEHVDTLQEIISTVPPVAATTTTTDKPLTETTIAKTKTNTLAVPETISQNELALESQTSSKTTLDDTPTVTPLESTMHVKETPAESTSTRGGSEDDGVWEFKLGQNHPLFHNSPLYELNALYVRKGAAPVGKEDMESRKAISVPNYWTATLTCPLTGQIFRAGRLRGQEYIIDSDGSVLYSRKNVAQQAAASRALDWFRCDDQNQLEPRLCKEDPLAALSTMEEHSRYEGKIDESEFVSGDEEYSDQEESDSDSDTEDEDTKQPSSKRDFEKDASQSSALTPLNEGTFKLMEEDEDNDDDEEEDEYLAIDNFEEEEDSQVEESTIPSAEPVEEHVIVNPSPRQQTPAQTLLQSLADNTLGISHYPRHFARVVPDPIYEVKHTTEWVKGWVRRERRESNDARYKNDPNAQRLIVKELSGEALLVRAKSVLTCLAQAIDDVPLGQQVIGTQNAAFSVLKLLWESKDAKPDADVYNLYIKCLDGPDGHVVAEKADVVVQCMQKGQSTNGYIPPPPNVNTFNTLIDLYAQPGKVRHEKALQYFSPTASTYWTLLATEAYKRNLNDDKAIFDDNFCRECISNIRDSSDTTVDDVELMNAPLRWSGGRKAFRRRIPWPNYAIFLREGFREYDEESLGVQRAKEIQEWVESNPCLPGVQPNIESYEAVIQGWLRTATRKGLGHAEDILNELLQEPTDSPCYPRLQTFHPVLISWLYSGAHNDGEKIRDWTDRIFAEAKKSNKIVPDVRIYEMAIHARLSILKKSYEGNDKLTFDESLALAMECSDLLSQFCENALESYADSEGPIFISLWRPFVFTMNAWQMCARARNNKSHGRYNVVPGIVLAQLKRTRTEFENLSSAIAEYEGIPQKDAGRLSEGMYDIVENSHRVYFMYTSVLQSLASKYRFESEIDPQGDCKSILMDVEGCVRKMGEFNELDGAHLAWKKESLESPPELIQRVYADHFDYGFENIYPKEQSMRRPVFPWSVVRLLDTLVDGNSGGSVPTGDVVRLCQLLKTVSRTWRIKTDAFYEEVTDVLNKVSPIRSSLSSTVLDSTASSSKRYIDSSIKNENEAKDKGKTIGKRHEKTRGFSPSSSSLLLNTIMEEMDTGNESDDDEDDFYKVDDNAKGITRSSSSARSSKTPSRASRANPRRATLKKKK